jgi:mono/diheme cytochrome c family protein
MNRALRTMMALTAIAATHACNRMQDDVREWRPSDHHDTESETAAGRAPQVSGSAEPAMPGLEEVTVAAWQRACTQCHGSLGRGDGPRGQMLKARDLSDPAWQASVTDAQIADAIVKGKNAMPASMLPASTVEGLVHLVRLLNRDRNPGNATAAGSSEAKQAHPPSR